MRKNQNHGLKHGENDEGIQIDLIEAANIIVIQPSQEVTSQTFPSQDMDL